MTVDAMIKLLIVAALLGPLVVLLVRSWWSLFRMSDAERYQAFEEIHEERWW